MNANRAIRIARHNERKVYEDLICVFTGRYDRQRLLVIRIAAITLASDSAITLERFRPSKPPPPMLIYIYIYIYIYTFFVSNSVLTLYGFILASVLNSFELRILLVRA